MLKKLASTTKLFVTSTALIWLSLLAGPLQVAAQTPGGTACPADNTPKGQVLSGVGQTGSDCSGSGISTLAGNVTDIMSYIVGIIAIIMIIAAGLKYITSGGDSNAIASAKKTLIYALVGLAIAVLAQFLAHFVLNVSINITG